MSGSGKQLVPHGSGSRRVAPASSTKAVAVAGSSRERTHEKVKYEKIVQNYPGGRYTFEHIAAEKEKRSGNHGVKKELCQKLRVEVEDECLGLVMEFNGKVTLNNTNPNTLAKKISSAASHSSTPKEKSSSSSSKSSSRSHSRR